MSKVVQNKKVFFNYDIIETYQAGISLLGLEVKSLKKGQGSLEGAYVILRGGEAFLVGATIPPYQVGNTPEDYDPMRTRKLLLSKKELGELEKQSQVKGLTIVPISVYNKEKLVKLEIGIGRGKKTIDKRETIKKRETKRDIERTLKNK